MKVERLRVAITPVIDGRGERTLYVETIADGKSFSVTVPFHENDFKSLFHILMRDAESAILKLVKQASK